MYKKQDVLDKIDSLNEYAAADGYDENKLETMVAPLKVAINNFFSTDYESNVKDCIKALAHGLFRAGITYADGHGSVNVSLIGWNDLRDVFNTGTGLMNLSDDLYLNSIEEVTPTPAPGETTTPEPYYRSDIVDNQIEIFTQAIALTSSRLSAISSTANNLCLSDGIQDIFEPKEIVSAPEVNDLAKEIYTDKHYKDVIEFYDMNIFVPQVVKDE